MLTNYSKAPQPRDAFSMSMDEDDGENGSTNVVQPACVSSIDTTSQEGDSSVVGSFAASSFSKPGTRRSEASGIFHNVWTAFTKQGPDAVSDSASADNDAWEDSACFTALASTAKGFVSGLATLRRSPSSLVATLLVFAALCAAGLVVTLRWADSIELQAREDATIVAKEIGSWFSDQLDAALMPLFTLSQFVQQIDTFKDLPNKIGAYCNPGTGSICPAEYAPPLKGKESSHRNLTGILDDAVIERFNKIAANIKKDANLEKVLVGVQLAPKAVVSLLYPLINTEDFDEGTVLDNTGAVGHDLLTDPNRVKIARATVPAKGVVMAGPLTLVQGNKPKVKEAIIARLPINMPGYSIVVDGTDYQCWGFAIVIFNWAELKTRSGLYDRFKEHRLHFNLTRTDFTVKDGVQSSKVAVIASSEEAGKINAKNNVSVPLNTTNNEWILTVSPHDGFRPSWVVPAIVAVVLGAMLISIQLMLILISHKQHQALLYKMMPKGAIAKLRRGETVCEKFSQVTIFFSDIVGYTSMAAEMTPMEVMAMLNQLYTEFDRLVAKHRVYKVETIGDAYMVMGGAPQRCDGPDAAEKVALFALEALQFVKDWRTSNGAQIAIRCGLATGAVVAGIVGDAMPRYCLFGDTVNFASRMESTSIKGMCQCAELTYHLLCRAPGYDFVCEERVEGGQRGIDVKGKGRLVTYWVKSASKRGGISGVNQVAAQPMNGVDRIESSDVDGEESSAVEAGDTKV